MAAFIVPLIDISLDVASMILAIIVLAFSEAPICRMLLLAGCVVQMGLGVHRLRMQCVLRDRQFISLVHTDSKDAQPCGQVDEWAHSAGPESLVPAAIPKTRSSVAAAAFAEDWPSKLAQADADLADLATQLSRAHHELEWFRELQKAQPAKILEAQHLLEKEVQTQAPAMCHKEMQTQQAPSTCHKEMQTEKAEMQDNVVVASLTKVGCHKEVVPNAPGGAAQLAILERLKKLAAENADLRLQISAASGAPECSSCSAQNNEVVVPATTSTTATGGTVSPDSSETKVPIVCSTSTENNEKQVLISRLTHLASQSADVREHLREKLQAVTGKKDQALTTEQAAPADPSNQTAASNGVAEESAAATVQHEIVARLKQLASENNDLKAKVAAATQLESVAAEQALELDRLKDESHKLASRLEEATAEIRKRRQCELAREVFHADKISELAVHWADGWRWPGGESSTRGVEQLRRSISGHSAELSIGPPPADWRSWLTLGLRRGVPTEPALLKLAVPDLEGVSYLGLLWSAASAA